MNLKKDGAPSTQARPGFSFSVGSRKSFPSKWDDAEKWLINGLHSPSNFMLKQCGINGSVIKQDEKDKETEGFADSVFEETKIVSLDHHHGCSDRGFSWISTFDVLLKDKLTNEVDPIFPKLKHLGAMEVIQAVKNRDMGTEMTPGGSSTASRCPTPLKSLSPPRHNTPESRLSLQGLMNQSSSQLECDLANKLQPWTPFDAFDSKWSSMEDEEEEISKSLRHFEMNNEVLETISGPRPSAWEEQELSEPCLRYQIKEAKIQAWVNHQKAKAEAESRKLEVKPSFKISKASSEVLRAMKWCTIIPSRIMEFSYLLLMAMMQVALVSIDYQDKALVRSTEVIKMLENEAESLFKNKCESKNFNVIHSEPFGVHVELLGPPMEGKPQVTVVGSALLLSGKRGGLKTLLRCSIIILNRNATTQKRFQIASLSVQ
ncbi:hypothetical protein L1987_49729 [Smallanthus sonchifolius]|uniref:Uncharacterized protein n=1 Tax=Smallanthus sonchifolius TaxID=185202 RepID=A0ACB9FWJ5_9ASTR|nr:hypothetical protein L1987_49729 [Smallanthus sonchifolius]